MSECHQHRPDQPVIPKGLSFPLSLSTKAAKFYITRSNASDRKETLSKNCRLYIHWYEYIINWCKTLRYPLSLPFLFLFPLPDSWSPFLSHYNSFEKISISPAPFFLSEIYHTIYLLIYTLPETDTKKTNIMPHPPPSNKKKGLKVKSSSPPDSTHLPPQATYSSFPLSADLPFSSTPHSHSHHSPLLPQQSE